MKRIYNAKKKIIARKPDIPYKNKNVKMSEETDLVSYIDI